MKSLRSINIGSLLGKTCEALRMAGHPTLLNNSCCKLRNEARKLAVLRRRKRFSLFDRQFYRPRPINQRIFSRTWLRKIESEEEPMPAQPFDRSVLTSLTKRISDCEPAFNDFNCDMRKRKISQSCKVEPKVVKSSRCRNKQRGSGNVKKSKASPINLAICKLGSLKHKSTRISYPRNNCIIRTSAFSLDRSTY